MDRARKATIREGRRACGVRFACRQCRAKEERGKEMNDVFILLGEMVREALKAQQRYRASPHHRGMGRLGGVGSHAGPVSSEHGSTDPLCTLTPSLSHSAF